MNYCWPHSEGPNQTGLAPLCRPKWTTAGPTQQGKINYCYPLPGHVSTTKYPNKTSLPAILPPCSTPASALHLTHYPIPEMGSHSLSDNGRSQPGYRAISQYIHSPSSFLLSPDGLPRVQAKNPSNPDILLIGGKLLIRAMIPTAGLTNPLLRSVKIPQTCNLHKLIEVHKLQTYNMYQFNNLPMTVTE